MLYTLFSGKVTFTVLSTYSFSNCTVPEIPASPNKLETQKPRSLTALFNTQSENQERF